MFPEAFYAHPMQETWPLLKAVDRLFEAEDYHALEAQAGPLKAMRDGMGHCPYYEIHDELGQPPDTPRMSDASGLLNRMRAFAQAAQAWPTHFVKLERWKHAVPSSALAPAMAAWTWIAFAWDARGSGYADTVSKGAWRLFEERIARAHEALERAPVKDDLNWHLPMLVVLRAESAGYEAAERLALQGAAVEPYCHRLYAELFSSAMPRWGGDPDLALGVLDMAERLTRERCGRAYYAMTYQRVFGCYGASLTHDMAFDWDRLKGGYLDCMRHFPTSVMLNEFARQCYFYDDQPTARVLLKQIGTRPFAETWTPVDEDFDPTFEEFRDWARGER